MQIKSLLIVSCILCLTMCLTCFGMNNVSASTHFPICSSCGCEDDHDDEESSGEEGHEDGEKH